MNHAETVHFSPVTAIDCNSIDKPADGAMSAAVCTTSTAASGLVKPRKLKAPPITSKNDKRWFLLSDVLLCGGNHYAALMLAQLRYWLEPDEETGKPRAHIHKAGEVWTAMSLTDWEPALGFSVRRARTASKVLEGRGLVVVREFMFNGSWTAHYRLTGAAADHLSKTTPLVENDTTNKAAADHVSKTTSAFELEPGPLVENDTPLVENDTTITEDLKKKKNKNLKTKTANEQPFAKTASPAPTLESSGKDKSNPTPNPETLATAWKKLKVDFNTACGSDVLPATVSEDEHRMLEQLRDHADHAKLDALAFVNWLTAARWQQIGLAFDAVLAPTLPFLLKTKHRQAAFAMYREHVGPAIVASSPADPQEPPATPPAEVTPSTGSLTPGEAAVAPPDGSAWELFQEPVDENELRAWIREWWDAQMLKIATEKAKKSMTPVKKWVA